jgi:hypothetical protein
MEDTTIEDVLKTIETLYAQKAYRDALDYLSQNQNSLSRGVWHYNMGTLFARLEDWPMARYHLMMADRSGYASIELSLNQRLVESKLSVKKWEKLLSSKDYAIRGALLGSEGIFTMIGFIMMIGGFYLLRNKSKQKGALATLFFSFLFFGATLWIKSWNWGIVLGPQVVREGPSLIFNSKEELPPGVMILSVRHGEWLKVIFPEKFEGWIKNANIKELR